VRARPILEAACSRFEILPEALAYDVDCLARRHLMSTKKAWLAALMMAMLTATSARTQQSVSPDSAAVPDMPKQATRAGKHINRVIDLWLKNQPVYYSQTSGGGYEQGRAMAATKADYITYEMEHGLLDFKELREFMRGLVDAGPTRTGDRICGMGARRSRLLSAGPPWHLSRRRRSITADGGRAAAGAQCHESGRDQVSQRVQREHRDRATEGGCDDLHRRRHACRGQGARVHQAHRSVVTP
jgi:hypothetical protein